MIPARLARELRAGRIDAIMAHQALITRRMVDAVRGAGGEIYAWTVDDAATIATSFPNFQALMASLGADFG